MQRCVKISKQLVKSFRRFKGLRHPEAAEITSKFTNFFLRNYECDNYFIIIYGSGIH